MAFRSLINKAKLAPDDLIWVIEADIETLEILLKNPNNFLMHVNEPVGSLKNINFRNERCSDTIVISIEYSTETPIDANFPYIIQGIDGTDVITVQVPLESSLWQANTDTDAYIEKILQNLNSAKSPWADFLLNAGETFSVDPGSVMTRANTNSRQKSFNIRNLCSHRVCYTHIDRFIVSDHVNNGRNNELTLTEIISKPYALLPIHKKWVQKTFNDTTGIEEDIPLDKLINFVLPDISEFSIVIQMPVNGLRDSDVACCKPKCLCKNNKAFLKTCVIAPYGTP